MTWRNQHPPHVPDHLRFKTWDDFRNLAGRYNTRVVICPDDVNDVRLLLARAHLMLDAMEGKAA